MGFKTDRTCSYFEKINQLLYQQQEDNCDTILIYEINVKNKDKLGLL